MAYIVCLFSLWHLWDLLFIFCCEQIVLKLKFKYIMQNWIFIITIFVSVNKREFTIFIIWIWFVHFSFRPVFLILISMRSHIETVIGLAYVQSVGRFPRTETIHRPLSVIWSWLNILPIFLWTNFEARDVSK